MTQPNYAGWQGDLFLHGLTQCAVCGDLMHQTEAKVRTFYKNHQQIQEHLCGDTCADTWLATMRAGGL